ncbi:MAG: inositol 2-dehydrogenase [Gammaproteobacteria bacterium]|nr:inositol 2-dehydrogenase [Gammaproteobacteria bacterium]
MLGIAVLGAGRIGKIHAANVAANRNARLVAVADPYGDAASSLASLHGAEAVLDPFAAIERADVDAVVIGTPTNTHLPLLLKAVELGKAALCEKPIDLDMERSRAAVAQIKERGGKVMMAFNRRFENTFAEMRRAIDAGEIGEVRQVVISSRDPGMPPAEYVRTSGGIFRDMTIHDLDMARFLLGEEPTEVSAVASRIVDSSLCEAHDDFDTVMLIMKTASGKQCHINNCREAVYGYDQRVEVFGSTGMLLQENQRKTSLRRWSATTTDAREPLLNFFLERYTQAYKSEVDAFVNALIKDLPLPTSLDDGLQALRLADCALEAVRTGRTVAV